MKPTKLAWQDKDTVAGNLEAVVPGMVRDFFVRGRQAAQADKPDDLHQFRLAAKQFRYTIELLKPAYGDGLEPYVAQVKELQDHLGRINDCATTLTLLEGPGAADTAEIGSFRQYLVKQQKTETKAFRTFWRAFDQHTTEAQWIRFLSTSHAKQK